MNKISIVLLVAFVTFSFACTRTAPVKPEANTATAKPSPQSGGFSADLKATPEVIEAGKSVELAFTVKDPGGQPFKDFDIVHEKPMHLLLVSQDLSEFYHEHPVPQKDGSLRAPFTFPNGGKYKLYIDFTPKGGKQVVKSFDIEVSGQARERNNLKVDEKPEKTVDSLFVSMKAESEIVSGRALNLNFQILDSKSRKPAVDLENYLGEKAHFVVISEDLSEFVHAHPMSHDHGTSSQTAESKAVIGAHIVFPKPGLYKIFAQFKRAGKITTVPFTVDVKDGQSRSESIKQMDVPKDAFRVTVDKDGFTPKEIKFGKGYYTKLAFVRLDEKNCAEEVVIKSLNITRKLPLGEVVVVDLPKDFTGELDFSCGMNMYKGKLIVD
jgi:hypothetical protein